MPNGSSQMPGFFTLPEKPISLVPWSPLPSRAREWYHLTPLPMIAGTLHSDSTLLTQVGLPHTPTAAGNGGLARGLARRPSSELISAVSSPQM
ncbi:hypothetical protein D3C81_1728610 [compost metagenome]